MDANTPSTTRVGWRVAMGTLTVVAIALIVLLSLEVRTLRPQSRELALRRAFPFPGQVVPTVRTVSLRGDSVTLGEVAEGRTQTLIVFSVTCPYCLKNLPTWKKLSADLLADPQHRYDVTWLSVSPPDSTAKYVAEHDIKFPVVHMPDYKTVRVYRIKGTPLTLVLNDRGEIMHVHASTFRTALAIDSVLSAARRPRKADSRGARASVTASRE